MLSIFFIKKSLFKKCLKFKCLLCQGKGEEVRQRWWGCREPDTPTIWDGRKSRKSPDLFVPGLLVHWLQLAWARSWGTGNSLTVLFCTYFPTSGEAPSHRICFCKILQPQAELFQPIRISIAGVISLKAIGEMQARIFDSIRGGGGEFHFVTIPHFLVHPPILREIGSRFNQEGGLTCKKEIFVCPSYPYNLSCPPLSWSCLSLRGDFLGVQFISRGHRNKVPECLQKKQ